MIELSDEVRVALDEGRPVVALETTLIAHGFPPGEGVAVGLESERRVREAGATPATIGVLDGEVHVGLDEDELERFGATARKLGPRDVAAAVAQRAVGATTVGGTLAVARAVGLRFMGTGGIGGVHRGWTQRPDISSDLGELARTRIVVVASGAKSILDVPATAEALETLGVLALGFKTSELPAFYCDRSGVALEHRVEDAVAAARLLRLQWGPLGRREGVLVLVPPPIPVPREVVEAAVSAALAEARQRAVRGKTVTPFLLEAVARATGGGARAANVALLERNAAVAGEIAAALAALG